jgi:maltose O-acetyltransferase
MAGMANRARHVLAKGAEALGLLFTDPAASREALGRAWAGVRAAFLLRGCQVGLAVRAFGPVRVLADGDIQLGERVQFWKGPVATELIAHEGAQLSVGAHALFNYGSSLEATRSVRIGDHCMFGSFVRIADASAGRTAPIVIEDNVWVGHGAVIQPGVRVGKGSVVSANSVVYDDVPPDSLAVGNPARCSPLQPRAAASNA